MASIDIDKINNQDYDYIFNIFYDRLNKNYSQSQEEKKYYYQYEFDGNNLTCYEHLMDNNIICIKADSYKQAMLLNVLLRTIIDNHTYSLECYYNDDDNDDDDNNSKEYVVIEKFFDRIETSESLNQYLNYCSSEIKSINHSSYSDKYDKYISKIKKPIVFHKENICKLIKNQELIELLKNKRKKNKLQKILDMLKD